MAGSEHLKELHARGVRRTVPRQLVFEALVDLGQATPEQICQHIQGLVPGVSLSTVYRVLNLFEELGVAHHTHDGHGPGTYHLQRDEEHVHLVCRDCRSVIEVDPTVFGDAFVTLMQVHGFAADASDLVLAGRCRRCRTQLQ